MPRHGCTGYRQIARQLRELWLSDWQPGLKLPSYQQLGKVFGTTPVTMQRAMDLLAEQGFIVTRPTVGSFLAARPPHACQVGLVFPGHPEEITHFGWSRNYLANLTVANQINADDDRWTCRFYMDVSAEAGTSRGLGRLVRDVEDRVLAGLVFNYSPHDLKRHPLLTAPPLPIVHYNPEFKTPGMGIRIDGDAFVTAALRQLRQRGLTEVAVLTTPVKQEALAAEMAAAGVALRPEWVLAASPFHPAWIGNAIAALLRPDGRPLPQALLIADDHFVEPAVAAIAELYGADETPPTILAHWNFPLPYRGKLPITRLGYDAHAWLTAALALIARHPEPSRGKGETAVIPRKLVDGHGQPLPVSPQPSVRSLLKQAKEALQCTLA